ncbi:adenylate/guanylate cyclase domain-containing protein [Alteromonas pelagimontana]|uniref:Adenylate/guanylate cyclase domain-containing protein n=1 Tax=Alteromonas pelagimontana TaxID=1858656 RepID=A0A6M4MH94_9ALTE|nr:adenylate/guanylate cyclase domain-containing protein [Alteromonas pelagimontana]QJR82412.1 adenylate/guanylate cyclase domain-containing protein [Alteromonas pelagimontana]
MHHQIFSSSTSSRGYLSALIKQITLMMSFCFVIQLSIAIYYVETIGAGGYINLLCHSAAIPLILLYCSRQQVLIARRLLNVIFASYLCCACVIWGMSLGIQHFLLLGNLVCGFFYRTNERTEQLGTAMAFSGLFIAIEMMNTDFAQWQHVVRLADSLTLTFATLIILLCFQRQTQTRWQALKKVNNDTRALLANIFPPSSSNNLQQLWPMGQTKTVSCASVMFADLQGFTRLSETFEDEEVVEILDSLYCQFDAIAKQLGVEKIKTNGDEYMAAVGIPSTVSSRPTSEPNAVTMYRFAWRINETFQRYCTRLHLPCNLRIGIATGAVTAGIIGKEKPVFDIWGKTVNRAARLEHAATPGTIFLCQNSYNAIVTYYNQPLAVPASSLSLTAFKVTHPPPAFVT